MGHETTPGEPPHARASDRNGPAKTATPAVTVAAATDRLAHQLGAWRQAGPSYLRERDLPRLVLLWPGEVLDLVRADPGVILARLRRAIRGERRRGLAGHWTYDLNRHAALLRACRAEMAMARAGSSQSPQERRPRRQVNPDARPARRQTPLICNEDPSPCREPQRPRRR